MNTKLKAAILIALIFTISITSLHVVNSLLTKSLTIPTSGSVASIVPVSKSGAYQSEIRALFVHAFSLIDPNWDLIAQTAKDYGINKLVVETAGNDFVRWDSAVQPNNGEWVLPDAVIAAHARGLELHIAMNVLAESYPTDHPEWRSKRSDGSWVTGLDPTNPDARQYLISLVQEVITMFPDIDGFMFDYIRYTWGDEPYTESARQSLSNYLGETITTWPGVFGPTGSQYNVFMEWRSKPITELLRDMHSAMVTIKPDLEISAAVWSWEVGWPTYWRYWLGQDWVDWIRQGYLDWVSPMVYTDDVTYLENFVREALQIAVAGPEGKIALVPFIDNCVDAVSTPQNFAQRVTKLRQIGADGWIVWRYGGPGDGQSSGAPDIRNYLNQISLPPTFAIGNITVTPSGTSAIIAWITNLPATSKVEYSTSPLFTSSFVYDSRVDFSYWDIDHAQGTIVEDAMAVIDHIINLTGLQTGTTYYYRIQGQDASGIATSKVYTFQL